MSHMLSFKVEMALQNLSDVRISGKRSDTLQNPQKKLGLLVARREKTGMQPEGPDLKV